MPVMPLYQVDAFTNEPFKGNPAAVCILDEMLPDDVLLDIASEMNLSETAFALPISEGRYQLRWFTPTVEVPLCGHATLATSAVLFNEMNIVSDEIVYETLSGELTAVREGSSIRLNLPSNPPSEGDMPVGMIQALGIEYFNEFGYARGGRSFIIELETPDEVRDLFPDFRAMEDCALDNEIMGVIATAKGEGEYDFISRFFAPWVGVDEDPVTGAAHTILAPYWAEKLGRDEMKAYQASERGGGLIVRVVGDRVHLIGEAVMVVRGVLSW